MTTVSASLAAAIAYPDIVLVFAGTALMQPAGIRHREIHHSDDLELIEITSPAEFKTESVEAPKT